MMFETIHILNDYSRYMLYSNSLYEKVLKRIFFQNLLILEIALECKRASFKFVIKHVTIIIGNFQKSKRFFLKVIM